MKKAILTLFLLLSLQSFSQKTMITQNPNITANNLVEEIAKQVSHYNYEPIYIMNLSTKYILSLVIVTLNCI